MTKKPRTDNNVLYKFGNEPKEMERLLTDSKNFNDPSIGRAINILVGYLFIRLRNIFLINNFDELIWLINLDHQNFRN